MIDFIRLTAVTMAAGRIKRSLRRSLFHIAMLGFGALAAMAGIGFCLNSLWIYTAMIHGPVNAGLLIGGGLIVLALAILAAATISRSRAAAAAPQALSIPSASESLTNHLNTVLQANNKLPAVALVVLFGYAMGRGLRRK